MTGRPLRPVTDRRLGRPLPYQLANPTWAHLIAPGLAVPGFPLSGVCGINPAFAGLSPTTWTCSDALLTRSPLAARVAPALPLDLHVLGLPPAFTLSQDQTLQLKFLASPADVRPRLLVACVSNYNLKLFG